MQLRDLSRQVAEELNLNEGTSHKILKTLIQHIRTGIESSDEFVVPQLGRFARKQTNSGVERIVFKPAKPKTEEK